MLLVVIRDYAQRIPRVVRSSRALRLGLVGFLLIALLGTLAVQILASEAHSSENPIVRENQRAGTPNWQSRWLAADQGRQQQAAPNDDDQQTPSAPSTPRPSLSRGAAQTAASSTADNSCTECWADTPLRGYASQASINAGQQVTFFVGTTQPSYTLEVYRMGYYSGAGARRILSVANLTGQNPAVPSPDPATGALELNWPASYTLATTSSWVSGVYIVKLTAINPNDDANPFVSYVPFIVRGDSQRADIVFQIPIATYQAYNNWGGKSLYDFNSSGAPNPAGGERAYKVSFDRPYSRGAGAGDLFRDDYSMIRYLEKNGYNVTYTTSLDTQTSPNLLKSRDVFLTDFHDEYYSAQMRANVDAALNQGTSLAYFSANNIYWQIRYEASSGGVANRVIVCYKDQSLDPVTATTPTLATVTWSDPLVKQPASALLGLAYGGQLSGDQPWVVSDSAAWIYSGTGLLNGVNIANMVGYEFNVLATDNSAPSNLKVISLSPATTSSGTPMIAAGAYYTAKSGARVFDAGTIDWALHLDNNSYWPTLADWRVQQMTANVLYDMINGRTPKLALPSTPPLPAPYTATVLRDSPLAYWRLGDVSGTVATDAQGGHNGAYVGHVDQNQSSALGNDPNGSAWFDGATGYVDVPYASALNPNAFTIEAWVNPQDDGDVCGAKTGTIHTCGIASSRNWPYGWVLYDDHRTWQFRINNGGAMSILNGPTVAQGSWVDLMATFDGATANFYVDGVIVASTTVTSYTPNPSSDLTIGQGASGDGFYFYGQVDNVSLYDHMLSPDQALAHYTAGIATLSATPVSLSNLVVKDTTNSANWSLQSSLQVGAKQYGDKDYTFTSVPAQLLGATWISTAQASQASKANPTVTFTLSQAATVYVAVDGRRGKPSWMGSLWSLSSLRLVNSEDAPSNTFALYKKVCPAGTVQLGPDGGAKSLNMYTVIVQ